MRELKMIEIGMVTGGGDTCSAGDGNDIGGITEPGSLGQDLIGIYEGLVEATSYIIERVAESF